MTYISSSSMTSPLRSSILNAQSALTQAQTEVSTGTYADIGLQLGGGTGHLLSLRSNVDALNTYTQTNAVASTRLSATDTALTAMLSTAQTLSATLTSAQSSGSSLTGLAQAGQGALEGLIGGLNTSAGGQFVFAGTATQTTPIADYTATSSAKSAVETAFQAYLTANGVTASTISGSQMQSFLSNQFASLFSSGGWQSSWSSASSQTMTTSITPSQTASTSVSANQGAFQTMAQAYTMLTEFTGDGMSADAKAAVVATAGKLVSTGIAGLTEVQAGVGVTQTAISQANTQIGAQTTLLSSSATNLDSVDTYALSSQVTQLQTQLEASYSLTSRLQQLSLVNYLTAG
ncbi:flagellar hook-associated family protein [Jatrophihabitans endophyticus]|uniref:flagellar hook-associated family protein n=1 Tax=Jatrophihabitans endophyticus TaxID=1206085 RepID=UPI0019E4E3F7|nr:flagellar hook-associated family protein [Jatrophihabitans endophyticus]MBE7190014.1 flagellar hook-associated family protein [Jatrophihabitans endophyticus]